MCAAHEHLASPSLEVCQRMGIAHDCQLQVCTRHLPAMRSRRHVRALRASLSNLCSSRLVRLVRVCALCADRLHRSASSSKHHPVLPAPLQKMAWYAAHKSVLAAWPLVVEGGTCSATCGQRECCETMQREPCSACVCASNVNCANNGRLDNGRRNAALNIRACHSIHSNKMAEEALRCMGSDLTTATCLVVAVPTAWLLMHLDPMHGLSAEH